MAAADVIFCQQGVTRPDQVFVIARLGLEEEVDKVEAKAADAEISRSGRATTQPSHSMPSDLDYPIITTARVHHRVGNNRNCDPQIIERVSDAGGMDSLNTCNPGS